ncbi:site-specific integrase [Pseudoxanthomonas wuyuanensis]|uniref:Site-specific recombinase XerD n=1 Tax=Pseudoxanthomonas wuyuanensis TaxID=1073196 RepID=A0A286D4L1_9GAMM|nr:integrase [Pseudoxanthomonas wuyuanensis]KAF1719777.1 integrase [Pseudoxanthomonas wuyuanensis]SOD53603.1 Site-specific recombinase XerD [Pseudoxanthomonas wuyuanensis]
MRPGRNRKFNPDIPAHIDQNALPVGIYWSDNRWFIYEPHPEGGRPRKRTVAFAKARLSELHAIMEVARGGDNRGSLGYLCDQFVKSGEFNSLASGTQKDYAQCASEAKGFVLTDGSKLGEVQVARLRVPAIQRMVEAIATGRQARGKLPALDPRPSKANHVLRYLRRLFAWGIRFGHCEHNPAQGVRQARELAEFKMPAPEVFVAMLEFVRVRGSLTAHTRGSVSPYLHAVMLLAYNVRLRGIEVTTLTDANHTEQGIRTNRRKGSRDNITEWNDALREAWDWLAKYRKERMKAHERPIPLKPERRRLLVSQSGTPLTKSALDSAWQRAITMAIREGVIAEEDRFSLHGLKHRGVTDTEGNFGDLQDSSGHVAPAMVRRYAHDVPVVQPPKLPKATGDQ